MKTFILVAAAVLCAQAFTDADIHEQWAQFKAKHNKLYRSALEERRRFGIFQENLKAIEEHNALYSAGAVTFEMGVTQFSDLNNEEFLEFVGKHWETLEELNSTEFEPTKETPATVDWREHGAVTEVKDQGTCLSGYAFSAAGAIEGRYQIKSGKLVSLSAQNLVDCTSSYGNIGCDGGTATSAYDFVQDHGIASADKYPYYGRTYKCKHRGIVLKIAGYSKVKRYNEKHLEAAAAEGPVSISICATPLMKQYTQGVFYDPKCSKTKLNHAALVVGYGVEDGKDYWIVKNSWGTTWGDKGYMKIAKGINHCGIASRGSFPIV